MKDASGTAGWRIYFDDDTTKRYGSSDSFDGLQTWTAKKELGGVSGTVRHFTVISENPAQLERATAPKAKPKSRRQGAAAQWRHGAAPRSTTAR